MTFATGGSHRLTYVKEATFGTTPSITLGNPMLRFRLTQNSIVANRDSFQSEELRGDQQISDLRLGVKQVSGDLNFELSYLSFDDFIEAVLGGTWAALFSDTDIDWSATAASNSISQGTGTDLTTVLSVGDYIRVSGFTNDENNGIFELTAVATNTLDLAPTGTLVDEAGGATVTVEQINGATLIAGLNQPSFTVENQYNDSGFDADSKFLVYEGLTVNTMNLSVTPNAIVTGSFGMIGEEPRAAPFSTTSLGDSFEEDVVRSGNTSPMDSFSGTVTEGVAGSPCVTAIEMTLTRNLNPEFCVGNDKTVRITPGRNNVSGTISAYFEDKSLLEKFLNETETSIEFSMLDPTGNSYTVTLPRIKYTGGDNSVTTEGAIVASFPFQALLDDVEGTNIKIVR